MFGIPDTPNPKPPEPPPPITLAERFISFARGLLDVLVTAMRRNPMPQPIEILLGRRIYRMRNRFQALLARFRAGTLPPPRVRRPAAPRRADAPPRPAWPAELAPRHLAEMLRRIPEAGWTCRCFLADIVHNDPEAPALVAASPHAGRLLRTFCRMLGIKLPPWLALPRRKRVYKPRPRKPRKPRDASKLGRIAYANLIAPECRDGPSGTRPPNRIGYARGPRLPRDYRPHSKNE